MTMAAVALEAKSLYRFFRAGDDETLALQGVSMQLAVGDFVAVTGPSGSGKSTLLACLAGTDEPDGGTVRVGGARLSHRSESERARIRARLIGLTFQTNNLLPHLTVAQNLQLVQHLGGGSADVDVLLTELGIDHRVHAYPHQLSGGELARAALAVGLANDPMVLLADEPTGELDLATEHVVLDLLRARARAGLAVLVASHSPAVRDAADRAFALADGRVVA